jgi:hypothetical protein
MGTVVDHRQIVGFEEQNLKIDWKENFKFPRVISKEI